MLGFDTSLALEMMIFILHASVLALVVLCLHSGYSEAYTVCWTNQQLYMNNQDITTYFPVNLACLTGAYSGNYLVQAFKGNFNFQYGDQLCNTNWKNDHYFESTDEHYNLGFPYQHQWTSKSNSFVPKVNVWCWWICSCKIQITLCLTSNGLGSGSQAQEAKPVLAHGSMVCQED